MENPFLEITARLDALAVDVRALKSRTMNDKPTDEIGGMELFCAVTGYAKRTGYKLTHRREVPHSSEVGASISSVRNWRHGSTRAAAARWPRSRWNAWPETSERAAHHRIPAQKTDCNVKTTNEPTFPGIRPRRLHDKPR